MPARLCRWCDWTISENSAPFETPDAGNFEFRVNVEPGAEESITYTVEFRLPRDRQAIAASVGFANFLLIQIP